MRTLANLFKQLRDRLIDEIHWLNLAVCRSVCFLIVKRFDALCRVP